MLYKLNQKKNWVVLTGCLLAWAGICIQLYTTLQNNQQPIGNVLIKFFSYFTVLTNLIVAIYYSSVFFTPSSDAARFFKKYSTTTAIAVYILVVGIIYNTSLRSIWTFTGWAKLANELLHTVTPFYFILYWALVAEKEKLYWRNTFYWMIYPALYLAYTLIRGTIVNTYPYPFIDVNKLGYSTALLNCLGVGLLFFFFFTLFIVLGNRFSRK